jgi:hypothetical protein
VSETVVFDDDLIGSEVYHLHQPVVLYIRSEELSR